MKGVSQTVWIVGALLLLALVLGILGWWFFTQTGVLGGQFSQSQCTLRKQQACQELQAANYPSEMTTRVLVKDITKYTSTPYDCTDTGTRIVSIWGEIECSVSGWWYVTAPGCSTNYAINVAGQSDCV